MKKSTFLYAVLSIAIVTGTAGSAQTGAERAAGSGANVYPTQAGFVDANGVMVYYMTIGRGEPLLIVHGGPGASHDYFLPYLIPLARTNQLIFIDERGSGRSPQLEDAKRYTVENMADDADGAVGVAGPSENLRFLLFISPDSPCTAT